MHFAKKLACGLLSVSLAACFAPIIPQKAYAENVAEAFDATDYASGIKLLVYRNGAYGWNNSTTKVPTLNGTPLQYVPDYDAWCTLTTSSQAPGASSLGEATLTASSKNAQIIGKPSFQGASLGGDINRNGTVNIVDAQIVYDMAAGTHKGFSSLSPQQWLMADVNGDYHLDATDAWAIQVGALGGSFETPTVTAARQRVATCETALADAQANAQVAEQNLASAQSAYNNATGGYDIIGLQKSYDQACTAYNKAVSDEAAAKKAFEDADKKLDEAVAAVENQSYTSERGSKGFFEWLAGDSTYNDHMAEFFCKTGTNVGATGDATSLENLKQAAAVVRAINELRATEGTAALKISPYLLIESQSNANYSSITTNHAPLVGYANADCLAFGSKTASSAAAAWWSEKTRFEKYCAEDPALASMNAWQVSSYSWSIYSECGHYLNMREAGFNIAGGALSNASGKVKTWDACFGKAGGSNMVAYTPDEFDALVDQYLAVVEAGKDAVAKAKQAGANYEAALNAYQAAQAATSAAQSSKDAAYSELRQAQAAFNGSPEYAASLYEQVEAAQAALNTANSAVATAQRNLDAANAALQNAR